MTELNSINNEYNYLIQKSDIKTVKETDDDIKIESHFLGLYDFQKSIQLQAELRKLAETSKCNFVIGLEHPAVLSLGYRAKIENEIKVHKIGANSNSLNELPVVQTSRGGLATIHSEGQLVIYPIINLRKLNLGVRDYVSILLVTTQELLKSLDIDSFTDSKDIGLYTRFGKIGFCGVQIKNGITQHGLSLNVRNDLTLFQEIRSCGVENSKIDSLSQYQITHTLSELYELWLKIFKINMMVKNKSCSS